MLESHKSPELDGHPFLKAALVLPLRYHRSSFRKRKRQVLEDDESIDEDTYKALKDQHDKDDIFSKDFELEEDKTGAHMDSYPTLLWFLFYMLIVRFQLVIFYNLYNLQHI